MAHSIFGWSYPPGCTGPDDREPPCRLCWLDECQCPECPECGGTGDPSCIADHGLVIDPVLLLAAEERRTCIEDDYGEPPDNSDEPWDD